MTAVRGKVVAVTGAGSGIGRALAAELVARGAHVALADIDEAGLRETARPLSRENRVTTHVVDVRSRAKMEAFAARVEEDHGGADIIINNAGVMVRATVDEISYDDFDFVMDVNLKGVVHGTKAFLPFLRKRPEGHIVNIASVNALVPFARNAPYNASKYAVLGFTETLIQELRGQSVKVTCVFPGGIQTNIVRKGRYVNEQEIAFFDRVARTSPAQAARVILDGVERNHEKVYIGADSKFIATAMRLIPKLTARWVGAASIDLKRAERLGLPLFASTLVRKESTRRLP